MKIELFILKNALNMTALELKVLLMGFNLSNIFRVNQKMEEDPNSTHDFLTLVGLVSYYGSGEED